MNPIAIRLLSQQLTSPLFTKPEEIVAHMGGMQAQDYRMVRWAVLMRSKRPSIEAFHQAYDEGKIIRLHLHRGTWQLVAGEDYWWMLDLLAPKSEAVIKGWMKSNREVFEDAELHTVRDLFMEMVEEKGSVTKKDFDDTLQQHGIQINDHCLSYHIRLAELSGMLCSGNLSPMTATYALAEKKVKRTQGLERDEMLVLLARKYFQSHSPAIFEDYLWWSGMSVADCRRSIDILGEELRKETWKGYDFYIHESCRTRGFRKGNTLLLPPYDEYLIGYKTRELALPPEHTSHAHTNNGIFFPVIAQDGIICGNWRPWKKNLETEYFHGIDDRSMCEASLVKQWQIFTSTK